MTSTFDRVYGALIGQAVGDALGAPTEGLSRAQIVERYGWVSDFVDDDPAGTDDTEYAVLTARLLLDHGMELTPEQVGAAWTRDLVHQVGGFFGGGFSEMTSINNLRAALAPPVTGSDNHELWSDGAAMRIAPVGILCAGDPAEAARLAAIEAQVSHAKDGIYCAQVVAAGVAAAMTAQSWEEVVEAALAAAPLDSWTGRTIRRAVDIGSAHTELSAALDDLYERISIFHYPFADVGPEATALAMGVFAAARGEYVPAVLGGANVGRDADTIAAMAGSLAGALHGAEAVPEEWRRRINAVRGHCITATAGTDLAELARELHAALLAAQTAA
ncbi:ADP-ribosylglycohydrolase family protein [Streptomyces spinoverrucosus]|uniref:ADP-ribosylglycohydrolase family protein n=1 Tax=Streptomyces spinoverrucosus TaxID=284043 RepID=UPI0027D9EAAA|nr:ADP-ribosylglycohydrolase family protein [Streptomyces spinoverrucosus]